MRPFKTTSNAADMAHRSLIVRGMLPISSRNGSIDRIGNRVVNDAKAGLQTDGGVGALGPIPAGAVPCSQGKPGRPRVECGDMPFLIKRDGTWLYRGTPINRRELVCLFAGVLKREADGSFWLETPVERGRIEVEDAPFVAVEMAWTGDERDQVLSFRTNVDEMVTAGPDHPIRVAHDLLTCEPTPYLRLRNGVGAAPIEARINRSVYYELVALAVPRFWHGRHVLGVWSCGQFFSLGDLPTGEV